MKYTPGPWEVIRPPTGAVDPVEASKIIYDSYIFWVANENGKLIARVGQQSDEKEANARLIAAAPDLLHALARFMTCISPDGTKCAPNDTDFIEGQKAVEKAIGKAIAKVEGK